MSRLTSLLFVIASAVLIPYAPGQTAASRDFQRLKEQRERAVAEIDQKYHESLKSLLARATKENDFNTVAAITAIIGPSQPAATPVKPMGLSSTPAPAKGGIWAQANSDGFFYVLINMPDGAVTGFLYNTAANKSSTINGKKIATGLEARWPSVYGGESWNGVFTERPDGGFDLARVYADGPSKGRKDNFQLRPLSGDEFKRVRKMLDAKVTSPEAKSAMRKVPHE